MAKMKATEEVSGGTLKRRSPVDRHYAKRPVQLNSTSLKLNGVGTTGDVAPGTPCQDSDGFGVRRFDGACGQSAPAPVIGTRIALFTYSAWAMGYLRSLG